ncbi:MscL family protein [Candidatus Wolfebacteria bacterium]|nr:MscL family protein [Candidatus Wolfebacteria bacterium]
MVQGFIQFVREQGVMGLAIGFILGAASKDVVSSLVDNIINPLVGLIWRSSEGLSGWSVGVVQTGAFISTLLDFLIIAAVVYLVFKGLKLDRLDMKKDK